MATLIAYINRVENGRTTEELNAIIREVERDKTISPRERSIVLGRAATYLDILDGTRQEQIGQ